jgi:formyl-CoA transferase
MGAVVIQIESIQDPDQDFPRHGSDFQIVHRNKRSMTLNLKDERGIRIPHALVGRADVLVEEFRPAVKDRLGIDYERLARVNPRLVYGSISGFGQSGPYRDRPGYDQIAQGAGGLMSISGEPGRGPMRVGIPIGDLTACMFLAQGILVALLEHERCGRGQWVTTSLLQAVVGMLDFHATRWLMDAEVPGQAGNDVRHRPIPEPRPARSAVRPTASQARGCSGAQPRPDDGASSPNT